MKYTKSLTQCYVNTSVKLFEFATLPVAGGALLGGVAGMAIAALITWGLNCSEENKATVGAIGLFSGTIIGGACGVPFLPVTACPAIFAAVVIALTTIMTYPCALVLDVFSLIYSALTDTASDNHANHLAAAPL